MSHSAGEKDIASAYCPLVLSFAACCIGVRDLVCHSHEGAAAALQTCQVCMFTGLHPISLLILTITSASAMTREKTLMKLTPCHEIDEEGAFYKMLAHLTSLMEFMKFRELLHAPDVMKWKQFWSLLHRKQTETSLGQFLGHFLNIYVNFSACMSNRCFRTCFLSIPFTVYKS